MLFEQNQVENRITTVLIFFNQQMVIVVVAVVVRLVFFSFPHSLQKNQKGTRT